MMVWCGDVAEKRHVVGVSPFRPAPNVWCPLVGEYFHTVPYKGTFIEDVDKYCSVGGNLHL